MKKGLKAVNRRAKRLEEREVFGMEEIDVLWDQPVGCTSVFDTGWETNPRPANPMSACVSNARDYGSCAGPCWWPAQTPDSMTNFYGQQSQCNAVERDWRQINTAIKTKF
jgi:hypothetical protein